MNPRTKAIIAERLIQLREERGLTRNQVADAIDLAPSTIAGYEQAYRVPIDVEMQREVARFLEQEYMGKKGSKKKRAGEKVIK